MIVGSQPQGNQLLFNLCNGTVPGTLSARFHPPKPIVIEKIPIATTPPHSRGGPTSTLPHFTAISAESLSRAVEIAKRDLKKKRWESANTGQNRSRSQTKPTKIVHSHSYQEKQRKRQQRRSPVLVIKERTEARPSQTKILQTEDVVVRSVGQKYKMKDLPARSMSPPTRDHPTTHEDRVLNEICRLRMEMTKCLQQMKLIKDQRELQPKVGVKASMYAEDVEEDRKRRIRAEERAIRSARTIYMLKQQSNRLHGEIKKLDTKVKIDTKKGPLTSRLAALHRSVVCALQLLVRQMSDDESLQSVARDYRDLAIIIRQLSICCAQLEITNGSLNAQEDLLDLIKDVAELNEIVEAEESRSTLTRASQLSDHQVHQQRKATRSNSESISKSHCTPIEKVKVVLNEFGGDLNAVKNITVDQRKAVLTCGIQKLLRSKAAKGTLSPSGSKTKFLPKKRRLRSSYGHRGRSRRGVLLVHENTGCVHGSSCSSCTDIASDNCERYTRATLSTHQKSVGPRDRRPTSPTRVKIVQPAVEAAGCRFAKPTFSKLQKEVTASREQSSHSTPCSSPQLTPRRIKSQRVVAAVDPSWRRNMENDVRNRIEPVLKDGQIAVDINKVTDEIIGELMEDMALELRKRQADDRATHQAAVLHDAPSVGAILIRLRQMELEEDDIRRRWTSLAYGELKPKTGATVRDAPGSPLPVEIFAGANGTSRAHSGHQDSPENFDSVEPFVFTKPHLKSVLRQAEFQIDKRPLHKKGTVVSLPSEVLCNIGQQVRDYEAYLRRHVSDRVEHFDPWRVVEEIADDILESCLHDVCLELEDINNDIVDHVYRSEFSLVPNDGQTV